MPTFAPTAIQYTITKNPEMAAPLALINLRFVYLKFSIARGYKMIKYAIIVVTLSVLTFQTILLFLKITPVILASPIINPLQLAVMKAGLPDPGEKIYTGVSIASSQTGLSKELLLALMYTESSFNKKAVSNKNYQGLMQIPWRILHEDVNILIGAKILLEKLVLTKGDLLKAIILYKGYSLSSGRGREQADKVIQLTRKLKDGI